MSTTQSISARAAILFAAAALLTAPAALAQPQAGDRVGEVAWVQGEVTGTPQGGSTAALAANDPVRLAQLIVTGARSGAGLAFEPRGALTLDPESRLTVDRDVYDEATGASESAVSLLLGKARLFLSRAFSGSFAIDTPAATIGVKGTALIVGVAADGTTQVWVLEGAGVDVTVTSKAGGALPLAEGFTTTVAPGYAPTPPVPFDPDGGAVAGVALPLPLPPQPGFADDPAVEPRIDDKPPDRGNDGGVDGGVNDPTGG